MTDESKLIVRPKQSDSLLSLSKLRSGLIARGRMDASVLVVPSRSEPTETFVPSFKPFKAEKKWASSWDGTRDPYPEFGNEIFRSSVDAEWAKTFDRIGLAWEYQPLKFDMGPTYFSYTPDFRVTGLSVPDSSRALYIEVKHFPDNVDLSKYVRFTQWYNCDLLVLAHAKGGVLRPNKERFFLALRCAHCNTYDCFSCNESPEDDYKPLHEVGRPHPDCEGERLERIVLHSYFLIQAGTIRKGQVVLPDRTKSGQKLSSTGRHIS
jgi:hypothetical protein